MGKPIKITCTFVGIFFLLGSQPNQSIACAGKEARQVYQEVDLENFEAAADLPGASPKVEYRLNKLWHLYSHKDQNSARAYARRHHMEMEKGQTDVEVVVLPSFSSPAKAMGFLTESREDRAAANQRSVAVVRNHIQRLGGRIHFHHQHLIGCKIPLLSLPELADVREVASVRLPQRPRLHTISEGVANIGANLFANLFSYKSTGAKVCIIDAGFQNYNQLLGTELPDSVTVRSFTEEGDIEADERHGTACAEIIHDIAPDADLYLANIYWTSDLLDAVNWAIEQEVDIISYSMGSYFSPGDGTGFQNSLAREAQARGITFVTSAGNSANDHWSGNFSDPDGDGWHNFSGGDELLEFHVPVSLGQEYGVEAILKWNDWGGWDDFNGYGGATMDFDLYLYIWDGSKWALVDTSLNRQPEFRWPYENTDLWVSNSQTRWGVAIRKISANGPAYMDLYIPVHSRDSLEYLVPEKSITAPADSPYVIAVGAVDALDSTYHFYSSRGPTLDGRLKPDICAPSGISTSNQAYGPLQEEGFFGTSASCPHFAGALALLKSITPYGLDEIIQILYSRAIDMGETGADNVYGRGRLNLRNQ